MKKIISVLALVLTVLIVLPTVVSATDGAADMLKSLGLFLGTEKGFELERVPTRAEAAVMLVRFLGKEDEAKKNFASASLPFNDVPQWAWPYVAYLYWNHLTVGVSDTEFGTGTDCSAQMFTTFILRALGYNDADDGDFTYADAITFGRAKDLITDDTYSNKEFLRDHMAKMSARALVLPTADDRYEALIYKLAREGAVTREQAEKVASDAKAKKHKLAFAGDSLTWSGCCTNQDEDSYPALVSKWLGADYLGWNFGQGGATYAFSTVNHAYIYINVPPFKQSLEYNPDLVLIMFGTNDAAYLGGNVSALANDARYVIQQYTKLKSKPFVTVVSAPSCPQLRSTLIAYTNPTIEGVANSLKLPFIDSFTATDDAKISYDNVHFTDEGYAKLAGTIFEQYAKILVKNGYMSQETADAKIKYMKIDVENAKNKVRIPVEWKSDAELVELYKKANPTGAQVKFICSDVDCSGGVYAITKKVYDSFSKTSTKNEEGWIRIDPANTVISFPDNSSYPLTQWPSGGFWDARANIREINGCYFLWLDNTYRFGDLDGGWKNDQRTISGPGVTKSDSFEFIVSTGKYGNRPISFVSVDEKKNGFIYNVPSEIVNEWNFIEGESEQMFGLTWNKVDTFGMYYRISYYEWAHNDDHKGFFRDKNVWKMERDYGTGLFVAKYKGEYFLWAKNDKNLAKSFNSDCIGLYWPVETDHGTVMHATSFYRFTGSERAGVSIPGNIVNFK